MKLSQLKQLIKEEILKEIRPVVSSLTVDPEMRAKWESNENLANAFDQALDEVEYLKECGLNFYTAEIVPTNSISWYKPLTPNEAGFEEFPVVLFTKGAEEVWWFDTAADSNVPWIKKLFKESKYQNNYISGSRMAYLLNKWYNNEPFTEFPESSK